MQDHELDAWLGDVAVTGEQRKQIRTAADRIAEHWSGHDEDAEREAALSGAAQIILGDETLESLGMQRTRARGAYLRAAAALAGGIIAEAERGETESAIARRAGIDRQPVRRVLGKGR